MYPICVFFSLKKVAKPNFWIFSSETADAINNVLQTLLEFELKLKMLLRSVQITLT